MTSKERLLVALEGGVPDMVPVEIGTSEMWPVRNSGLNYIEFFFYEKRPLWKARLEVARKFNADGWLHGSRGPSARGPEITEEILSDESDKKVLRQTAKSRKGCLTREIVYFSDHPVSVLCGWIQDVPGEYEMALEFLGEPADCDYSEFQMMYRDAGEDAMVGYWVPTPVDWWADLRGTPEKAVLDLFDYPDLMRKLFEMYAEFSAAEVDFICNHFPVDSIGLGGSVSSMSVTSPAILKDWQCSFIEKVCEVAHRYGKIVQLHMCGKSRRALDILIETSLDAIEPLERPPTGDCDLAEVKKTFGGKLSLKGNVNSIETMLRGSLADVEREAKWCIEVASPGGGYILAVGDQTPYWTPSENIHALVETARRFGRYR